MLQNYVDLLKEELAYAKQRYKQADNEGRPIVAHQIREIERDIRRLKITENVG